MSGNIPVDRVSAQNGNTIRKIKTQIKEIKKNIKYIKEEDYRVYIRMRHLPYFISITRSLFKKITYQIEYARLKRRHPELKKELQIQYEDLHYYQDMMFFMCWLVAGH